MLLVIDLGNTNTVFGVYTGGRLDRSWRLSTRLDRTVDEYGLLVRSLFGLEGLDVGAVQAVVIASVVPALDSRLTGMVEACFGVPPLFVTAENAGVKILYDDPREVGADRISDAVAAIERYGGPVIVVDLGTATTFNAINGRNEYLGGLIAPGVEVSARALIDRAAKLPRVELKRPDTLIGRSTTASLESGFFWGYVSLVDGIVDRMQAELGGETRVVATGGWSRLIASESRRITVTDSDLTLDGLYLVARRLSKI
jgi:type III pantothenate kinase